MTTDHTSKLLIARDTGGCLDAAIQLVGRNLGTVLAVWLVAAAPTAFLVYATMLFSELDIRFAIVVVYLATVPLGYLLIQGMTPAVFGQPWTVSTTFQAANRSSLRPLSQALGNRLLLGLGPAVLMFTEGTLWTVLGAVLCVLPGLWVLIRGSFVYEKATLSRLGEHLHSRHTRELIKEHYGLLLQRMVWMTLYCSLVFLSLLVGLDQLLNLLFTRSLFSPVTQSEGSRLDSQFAQFDMLLDYIKTEPTVAATVCMLILLVYIVGRVSWFLSYIDLRVRYDCWDMELQFFEQAKRLSPES